MYTRFRTFVSALSCTLLLASCTWDQSAVAPRVHDVPPPSRDLLPILLRYLNPAHGPTAGGIEVALVGANFQGGTVFFDTTIATLVSADDTVLVAIAPPGEGIVPVYVTDGPDTTDMLSFRYDVPSITSISPAGGPAGGGAQVTLSGDNFGLNPTVLFDATAASIVSHTHTQIVVQSPAGTPGSQASVTVVVAGQTSNALSYTYDGPALAALDPAHGPTAGGTTVTLLGSSFGASPTVTFGGAVATVQSSIYTQITVLSPAGEGTVPVVVHSGATSSNAMDFTYDAPTLAALTPAGGPASGGTAVTLSGTNFGLNPTVLFDATPASIVSHTHTQIIAESPAGTPGSQASVTVVVAGQASNALSYAYVCADGTELQGGVCEPDSPSQWIQNLEDLVAALPAAAQRGLGSSLKQAVAILQDGNTRNDVAACGKLQAFVHQVDAMVKTHRLSASDAAALVDAATHAMLAAGCHV